VSRSRLTTEGGPPAGGAPPSNGGRRGARWAPRRFSHVRSTDAQIGPCVDALDCFNNGGQFNAATGQCTIGPDNCEIRDLPLETLGLTACPDKSGNLKEGSSGSSGECRAARANRITIFL